MNLQTLIQLLQSVREEFGVLAWAALGLILSVFIVVGLVAVGWIRRGGLAPESKYQFFADQREIDAWLRER
jgi:hypothetical protein